MAKSREYRRGCKINGFITLHMPLTDKTKNLVNYNLLKTMKKIVF